MSGKNKIILGEVLVFGTNCETKGIEKTHKFKEFDFLMNYVFIPRTKMCYGDGNIY